MSDQEQPKRRGRPPKYAGEGKRQNFSFRIRDKMRDRLIEAVQDSGRSLSEEIDYRLERSFEVEALMNSIGNETMWNVMEMLKANKGKSIDLEFATALVGAISRAERETRGVNSQLLREDYMHSVSAIYRATPEPGHRESQVDDEANTLQEEIPPARATKRAKPRGE